MVGIAKTFDDDMNAYLDKLYGKKERYVDTVKKKKSKPVVEKVPESISEEEIFVEYETSKPTFSGWLAGLFSSSAKSRIPEDEEDVPLEDLPPEVTKELEAEEDELQEVEHEIEELEERREGLLERFLNTLRRSKKPAAEEFDDLEDMPVLDEEVKEVLKRLHVWIEKLPNREMREFKISDDFELYKSLLKKYGLIK